MEIKHTIDARPYTVRFCAEQDGQEIGHAHLVVLYNSLHEEPYGLLEDIFVTETYRGHGLGTRLFEAVLTEAKTRGCYKMIATSRDTRPEVHAWYERMGMKRWGAEFRVDFV